MAKLKYSMMNDDWLVEKDDSSFTSPLYKGRPGQMVIFGERIRNGSISADITLLETAERRDGTLALEACLIARYTGEESYYYAGTGAFATKFFLGKTLPGPLWQMRTDLGSSDNIHKNKTYRLRLEFNGSQLTLYENDVQQLILFDEAYQTGQCGLKTYQTKARFENIQVVRAKPKVFLVMPFASELDFVHRVINKVVTAYGIDCVRADEIAISRPVMDDVKNQIAAADLVIVDFTNKNPNVYYEAGLADAWKKDWIVLAQSSEDMTFDVRHIRSIRYANTMGADIVLEQNLSRALEALGYQREETKRSTETQTYNHPEQNQKSRTRENPPRRPRQSRAEDRRNPDSSRKPIAL